MSDVPSHPVLAGDEAFLVRPPASTLIDVSVPSDDGAASSYQVVNSVMSLLQIVMKRYLWACKARAPYQTVFPRFKFDLGTIASDLSQGVELSMGFMEAKLKYWVWQEFGDIKSPEVEVDLQEPLLVV